ncbi:MAG: glycosyltransferase family 39 protein [Candidatus Dormibacteraeota bacterium]|nr:glycosyltransferase family 39 protein [Candidatus Dormibacteraeota bacterium]
MIAILTSNGRAVSTRLRAGASGLTNPSGAVALLGLCGFAAHMLVASNYGYFRDELYYLAAGNHLSLGYVDFPFLIPLLAWLVSRTAGDSLVAIHVIPALANGALIVVTGTIARELGGRRLAQTLAAAGSLVCLTFLATGAIFSMDALDELWWALIALLVIRMVRRGEPRLWLAVGAVAGLGMATKVTILFFIAALGGGLLATPARAYLQSRWAWVGAAVAAIFLAPYVVWEFQSGWPTLPYWHNYLGTLVPPSPVNFAAQQAYVMNPLTLPLWLGGTYWYLRGRGGPELRALGIAFTALFVYFAFTPTKSYYLAPAYPMMFAAGAVWLEARGAAARIGRWFWGYLAALGISGALLAPIAMPILPPPTFASAYGFLGSDAGAKIALHQNAVLPQWLADRFGWESLVHEVAAVYYRLPVRKRREACIFTDDYGEAAAIDVLGTAEGLPPAISGNNSFYFWGPSGCTAHVVITVGVTRRDASAAFRHVSAAGRTKCSYCMPQEDGVPILVAQQPRRPIGLLWPTVEQLN